MIRQLARPAQPPFQYIFFNPGECRIRCIDFERGSKFAVIRTCALGYLGRHYMSALADLAAETLPGHFIAVVTEPAIG